MIVPTLEEEQKNINELIEEAEAEAESNPNTSQKRM